MKDITPKLINLFKSGFCTPQIARLAIKLKEPSTTLHYNIKKLEREGKIKTYKAVFDYKKIDEGHCSYVLANLTKDNYANPEEICRKISKDEKVESVDIVTGDYEILIKLRTKNVDEYYDWSKQRLVELVKHS